MINFRLIEFMKEGYSKKVCEKYKRNFSFMRKISLGIAEHENILEALFYANGWKGLIGLELSKIKLKEFQDKNKRLSTQREFEVISNKIIHKRKYWTKFGINIWNDLLKTAFGTINKERNKYIGKERLERAKKELLQFEKKNGKIPTSKNKGMNTIYTTARLGKWIDFGIKSWRDLINYAFSI